MKIGLCHCKNMLLTLESDVLNACCKAVGSNAMYETPVTHQTITSPRRLNIHTSCHNNSLTVNTSVSPSSPDLLQHPPAVSQGVVRVQVHANGSKLGQFLLQFRHQQGEGNMEKRCHGD